MMTKRESITAPDRVRQRRHKPSLVIDNRMVKCFTAWSIADLFSGDNGKCFSVENQANLKNESSEISKISDKIKIIIDHFSRITDKSYNGRVTATQHNLIRKWLSHCSKKMAE
jgi:hypothetical protein